MDAFYVSAELLRRPELRGKPVIVAGRGPRAVVTTASYEARKFGVGSAMPASRARRQCPDGVYLSPDFPYYRELSGRVHAIMGELGVPTEPVSLDEAYLDLTGVEGPIAVMSEMVKRIREELGLDASVGIGPNKLVAKVASDAEKPRGFVVLTREQAAQRFAAQPVGLIPGIGPKTSERLASEGVRTLGQLQRCTVAGLIARFGESHGRGLHERSHFRSDSPVSTDREAKSRSVESTFDVDIRGLEEMEKIVAEQAVRLGGQLSERGIAGRTIAIKVRTNDFSTYTRARSLPKPTADGELIRELALTLLRENPPERPVRLLGVRVGSFGEAPARPAPPGALNLLDETA
ncbi:DNA polymerase IV [soil metagenome]